MVQGKGNWYFYCSFKEELQSKNFEGYYLSLMFWPHFCSDYIPRKFMCFLCLSIFISYDTSLTRQLVLTCLLNTINSVSGILFLLWLFSHKGCSFFCAAEFSCQLCHKVLTLPITTPCAHNYCKACLDGAFEGQKFLRERKTGGRSLRTQKTVMKCPSCTTDISEFLQNAQVCISLL